MNPQDIFKNEDYSNNMHTATDIKFDTDDVETIVMNFADTKKPEFTYMSIIIDPHLLFQDWILLFILA